MEDAPSIGAAQRGIDHAFGVRHEAEDIALLAQDSGDVAGGAVRVFAFGITERDAAFALKAIERRIIGEVISFAMRDGEADGLTLGVGAREGGLGFFDG